MASMLEAPNTIWRTLTQSDRPTISASRALPIWVDVGSMLIKTLAVHI
jgi:hypothetical protein